MYGSIFIQICAVGSKRRIFSAPDCVLAVQGRSGSSKVWFWHQWKRVYDFLLVSHCDSDYGPILHRFQDEKLPILLPLSHSAPSLPMFPLEFRTAVNLQETTVMWLSYSEDRMIVAGVVLAWYQHVTDGRSDRIYHS